ncbi:MAG: hypothetical protein JRJ38_16600 [Deltaproteobacteria bacterium]|nr:hypothetical protein [Deltaproteobacteria bacterium]
MITAAHVLESIKGDKATLYLREETETKSFKTLKHKIDIREKGKQLWVRHPTADVAAMYVGVPGRAADVPLLHDEFLITENALKEWEIHPGDELLCLGYPFGISANEAGFPILRSGKIASYPLIPTKK